MANPQGTPGQGTASGVSQEGHQGHRAAAGPTLTDPASSAKGLGAVRCWDLASGGPGLRQRGTAEGQRDSHGRKEASTATGFLLRQVITLFPTVI